MDALLGRYGININRIRYDVVPEDYPLLLTLMQMEHDKQLPVVEAIVRKYHGKGEPLKAALKRHDRGRLWKYLLKKYFPQLRAVRIMPIDERLVDTSRCPKQSSSMQNCRSRSPTSMWKCRSRNQLPSSRNAGNC